MNEQQVTARLFGTFLTWLSDHESDVFVVTTANGIDKLPPEVLTPLPRTALVACATSLHRLG